MWRLHVWFFMIFPITLENDGYMYETSQVYGTLSLSLCVYIYIYIIKKYG